jgi:hypothetical protein
MMGGGQRRSARSDEDDDDANFSFSASFAFGSTCSPPGLEIDLCNVIGWAGLGWAVPGWAGFARACFVLGIRVVLYVVVLLSSVVIVVLVFGGRVPMCLMCAPLTMIWAGLGWAVCPRACCFLAVCACGLHTICPVSLVLARIVGLVCFRLDLLALLLGLEIDLCNAWLCFIGLGVLFPTACGLTSNHVNDMGTHVIEMGTHVLDDRCPA